MTGREEEFEALRPHALRVAYQMIGSVTDAEDLVQEAWIRWNGADRARIESPRAWLTTVVTRLSMNYLDSARVRRERYVGTWLPEPILTEPEASAQVRVEIDESLTLAFMVLLESLSPKERAVFLLHEVFGMPHGQVADVLGTAEASSRQLLHRARAQIRARRPRFTATEEAHRELLDRFREASRSGDVDALAELLVEDVVVLSDGGGKARAAPRPVHGRDRVARFVVGALAKLVPDTVESRFARINGVPGLIAASDGRTLAVISAEVRDGLIQSLYIVTNPDKLAGVGPGGQAQHDRSD
jgi:RNA polymerase sigma-70 factor (ECF subfamily)